jgi:hypothetical protein
MDDVYREPLAFVRLRIDAIEKDDFFHLPK